jgi:SAM-dependent methyltransferase
MREASKTQDIRPLNFSDEYLSGRVLDIGAGDDLVCAWAEGFDLIHGDANRIDQYFEPNTFDSVHSSHCLEHMIDPIKALMGWWAVLKPNGYLILVVPHEDLYEQTIWPSIFNADHKSTFRLNQKESWSPVSYDALEICANLPNQQIISAEIHDNHYDYSLQYKGGMNYCKKKPVFTKWLLSLAKRLPFIGDSLKRLTCGLLVNRYQFPIDQTLGKASAQIQIVVKKLA